MIDSFWGILFPEVCVGCGDAVENGAGICRPCFEKVPTNKSLFCGECSARIPKDKKICHYGFPYVLGAATSYKNEMVRELVKELKFKFIKNSARPLAELLISYFENIGIPKGKWLVVPIPLGKKRLRKRGFNQSARIAEIFAEHFSLPLEKENLIRVKETSAQSEMENFELRFKNMRGCFAVVSPEKFSENDIILIDDVSTSGATFREAADSLKTAGARKIIALAAAKG